MKGSENLFEMGTSIRRLAIAIGIDGEKSMGSLLNRESRGKYLSIRQIIQFEFGLPQKNVCMDRFYATFPSFWFVFFTLVDF